MVERLMRSFEKSNLLFDRALKTIPLASQTFSKSAMTTVEGAAPLFLDHGRGASVWDVDENEYIDYVLGLLPVILGYRDPDVDAAICDQLDRGICFSLATDLEPELAETLVDIIPCAEMVRFGKNGSDVTSAAIRLARAYTKRERIALSGYHGWHDWYIGTTTRHLGVPDAVRMLSSRFPFNDANRLEELFKSDPSGYAAVILEPASLEAPAPGFLEAVRGLCDKYGVILIFDEIITGFRMHVGGAQAAFGVTPDLAAFGKAMGNGMPISAIVGRRDIMLKMEEIFFSGTFGGEALSLAAAISTIAKLRERNVPEVIARVGRSLKEGVGSKIAARGLSEELTIAGGDWWPTIQASGSRRVDQIILSSLLKQELINEGILMGSTFNICLAHEDSKVIEETLNAFDRALDVVCDAVLSGNPAARLRGSPMRPVFQVRGV